MNTHLIRSISLAALIILFASCTNTAHNPGNGHAVGDTVPVAGQPDGMDNKQVVHLSQAAFKRLDIHLDTIAVRMLSGTIAANGRLEVPPQHEAMVTAVVGANVTAIEVIEGDKVSKGSVLAYLAHPDLIQLQTDYVKAVAQLQFLEQEMQRQKRLYTAEVGAGKTYQKVAADYRVQNASVQGLEAQLAQLHLNVAKIRDGKLYQQVPVVSPISGYIEKLEVEVGQYVPPQQGMFQVVNSEHVHADLMVFEKDVHRLKEGQTVLLSTASAPGQLLEAKIFAIGKKIEQDPRAVHIHAEIKDKSGHHLIPGMYVQGEIQAGGERMKALPDEAIASDNGRSYIFIAETAEEGGTRTWVFTKAEVRTGETADGWTAVEPLQPIAEGAKIAWNNAYYLIAELNKGEAEHHH